jgi:hypothetical protein
MEELSLGQIGGSRVVPPSLPSATMSSPSVLHDIDARIHASDSELDFKRAQNALLPICRLPPEIVVAIITHMQHRSWSFDDLFVQYNHSWVRIMLVCRYFREIAVQTPVLWTVVNYCEGSKRWRNLCIERSQTAPLCVYSETALPPDQWEQVRIAHLVKYSGESEDAFRCPASLLQELKIRGLFTVSTALLHSVATSLRFLHLSGLETCPILDDTLSLPSLRHLKVSDTRFSYNLHEFVHLLQGMPMLDTLFVKNFYLLEDTWELVDANETIPISHPVTMPNLCLLQIVDQPAEAWALMRLIFAPLATLSVSLLCVGIEPRNQWTSQGRIVDRWMKLSRGRSPASSAKCLGGSIHLNPFELEDEPNFGIITFTYSQDTTSVLGQTSFCTINCNLVCPHPLLDLIETLHLSRAKLTQFASWEDLQLTSGAQYLTTVHTLVLEGLRGDEGEREGMASVKEWIGHRAGQIKHVRFIKCDKDSERLAMELQREGLVPDVVWCGT